VLIRQEKPRIPQFARNTAGFVKIPHFVHLAEMYFCYTNYTMNPDPKQLKKKISQTLLTKSFYQFLFSFVGVIATVLVLVLVLGVQVGE